MMKELRDAILEVLKQSTTPEGGVRCCDRNALYILQEEFNIHFVEPEDEQITLIKR